MTILRFKVDSPDVPGGIVQVPVSGVYNFGYAGRDQESVRAHIREGQDRGVPAPRTVPALYPLGAQGATTETKISVFGDRTYGEVEYALVNSSCGWLVSVASDHSDALVETVSVSRAKRSCPDVLAGSAWLLVDVAGIFDQLELVSECAARLDDVAVQVQRDSCGALLAPTALLSIWADRVGHTPPEGTVILSGTIGGDPTPGMARWQMALRDPRRNSDLRLTYDVSSLPDELSDPTTRSGLTTTEPGVHA